MNSKPYFDSSQSPLLPEMIHIPAGKFLMGSSEQDPLARPNEKPQHIVELSDYWISRYPITNRQYAYFLEMQLQTEKPLIKLEIYWNESQFHELLVQWFNLEELKTLSMRLHLNYDNIGGETLDAKARELILCLKRNNRLLDLQQILIKQRDFLQEELIHKFYDQYKKENEHVFASGLENHPIVSVSLESAKAYCIWLSNTTREHFRLPTEQEWEKAARGSFPSLNQYTWGNNELLGACNTKESKIGMTTAVNQYEDTNTSPYKVVDLLGNVWEWTSSSYKQYENSPHLSAYSKLIEQRMVIRGGCWKYPVREARISSRGRYPPETKNAYLGFRIAKY